MKVISTVLSLLIVDKVGRKKCLIMGALAMAVAVLTLGVFALIDGSEASRQTCHEYVNGTLIINGTTTLRPLDVDE